MLHALTIDISIHRIPYTTLCVQHISAAVNKVDVNKDIIIPIWNSMYGSVCLDANSKKRNTLSMTQAEILKKESMAKEEQNDTKRCCMFVYEYEALRSK